jgi:putative aminopeptidase FrvX
MNPESKEFLGKLLMESGASGFEENPQRVWRKRTKKYADKVDTDIMGNSIAVLNPKAEYKIMLAGHCDEIGLILTHISAEGFLYFDTIGGIDRSVVCGSHVDILTEKGKVRGIIGKKAIHLETAAERGKVPKIKDLYIDIGATSKKDAKKVVEVGDSVTFIPNYTELRNGIFTSKACDDRVGAFVASEVIKILSKKRNKLKVGVYSTATVQEEVGLRGATTSAFGINPNVGFAIDVSWTSDTPEACKKELGEVDLGKGGILHPGPANNRILYNLVKSVGKSGKIPYQVQSSGYPDGTDTAAIQLSRSGVATVLISIPNRYMHTMVETCAYKDLENTAKLIANTILKIKPTTSFIPR